MGILVVVIGLAISIGLHEFGHLIPAKLFGVRVPHWAIGFGPKLFSKKIGETEYSFRLIPLGGFITMIGMYPPDRKGKDSKRPFGRLIAQAREAHKEHEQPGDAGVRTLYSLPAWKRIIIMFGGPFTNLVLGLVILTSVFATVGTSTQTNKVNSVVECLQAMTGGSCDDSSQPTPAKLAGLEPGDQIVSVNGTSTADAEAVQNLVRATDAVVRLEVLRGETEIPVNLSAATVNLTTRNEDGSEVTKATRVIGVVFGSEQSPVGFAEAAGSATEVLTGTFGFIGSFPEQVYSAVAKTFAGEPRDPTGAISIVGVAQASGASDSVAYWLFLIGSLNIALFVFNMLPLPPLDGGHIAGGIYEYLKRGAYRLAGKKDPGPVDTALMAPVAQFMFVALLLAGILMIIADSVNPISF